MPSIDLRTYLLLEKAFVGRLQRSWRQQSAPIYAAIAKACNDHQWDKARQLVTDLDMTEVGTENREWITYMLLSCAVFGAGIVSRGKPSFVGVGTFDTFLKQTTNNFLMYLEYTATARVQAEALQSIAEDEAKVKALKWDPAQPRDEKGRWVDTEGVTHVGDFVELYHGTSSLRANKILKEGLKIRAVRQQTMGGDPESSRNYIWLAKRPQSAQSYAEMHAHPAVLTVHMPVAQYEQLKRLNSGPDSVWSREPIPAKFVRTLKWDEQKHPRDKEGQFTDKVGAPSGLHEGEPIEGTGPARREWERLTKEVTRTFDVYWDAQVEYRTQQRLARERLTKDHPTEQVEALIASDPAVMQAKAVHDATKQANDAAEKAVITHEPEMRKEVITNLATDVATTLGVNPSVVDVVYVDPREFTVGDKHLAEAGHYDPKTGRIELNAKNISYANPTVAKGLAAHEMSHLIYHAAKKASEVEYQKYLSLAVTPDGSDYTPWYHERFTSNHKLKPSYHAEFERDFPAAAALSPLSSGGFFKGISNQMVAEDGHSAYSKSYWTEQAVKSRGYESAITETMAELTRYLTYPASWREQQPDPNSKWLAATKALHEWYRDQSQ